MRSVSDQCIHIKAKNLTLDKYFYCTFVYASNNAAGRTMLWSDLVNFRPYDGEAWMITSDFNSPLTTEEIGRPVQHAEIRGFANYLSTCDIANLPATGCTYTWSTKSLMAVECCQELTDVL